MGLIGSLEFIRPEENQGSNTPSPTIGGKGSYQATAAQPYPQNRDQYYRGMGYRMSGGQMQYMPFFNAPYSLYSNPYNQTPMFGGGMLPFFGPFGASPGMFFGGRAGFPFIF